MHVARVFVFLVTCWYALSPSPSFGQSGGGQPDSAAATKARGLFEEGRVLAEAGKWEQACAKFEESSLLVQAIGTWLNLGDCYEKLDRKLDARRAFRTAVELAGATDKRGSYAMQRAAAVEATLVRLLIVSREQRSSIQVALDDRVLAVDETVVFVLPGSHTISASQSGKKTWSTQIAASAGERPTVEIPLLEVAPVVLEPPKKTPELSQVMKTRRKPAWVYGSVALAAVGAGAGGFALYSSLDTRSDYQAVKKQCGSAGCTQEQAREIDELQKRADRATFIAVGAGALVTAAVIVFVVAPKQRYEVARPVVVVPSAGNPGMVGLSIRF